MFEIGVSQKCMARCGEFLLFTGNAAKVPHDVINCSFKTVFCHLGKKIIIFPSQTKIYENWVNHIIEQVSQNFAALQVVVFM